MDKITAYVIGAVYMGGYQIAEKLSLSKDMALFSGIIVASTLGATISFSIPAALGMFSGLSKEDLNCFSRGTMIGLITIPAGCLAAGIFQHIKILLLLFNMIPNSYSTCRSVPYA